MSIEVYVDLGVKICMSKKVRVFVVFVRGGDPKTDVYPKIDVHFLQGGNGGAMCWNLVSGH